MKWGNWIFDPNNLTLTYDIEGYEIDLEGIHSSAEILDWIFQIYGKSWADANTLYDLLTAFHDILHPQANFCSLGQDKPSDGGKIAGEFAKSTELRGIH